MGLQGQPGEGVLMIRGPGAVLATVAVLAGIPAGAARATLPGTGEGITAARAAVPRQFRANSITWISPRRGWVLGAARCGAKTCTDVIATSNGGATWKLRGTVPAQIPQVGEPGSGVSQVRFGTAQAGWAFGPRLYRTGDGSAALFEETSVLLLRLAWRSPARRDRQGPPCGRPAGQPPHRDGVSWGPCSRSRARPARCQSRSQLSGLALAAATGTGASP